MKKTLAVAAVLVAILTPAGAASAAEVPGKAWGNCKNSAAGGKELLSGNAGKNGLGGFAKTASCTSPGTGGSGGGGGSLDG
ncbi:MAG: hypothetical protein M3P46_06905 [Actinomycetota bacterium]|nr:hypothetical protein [Actinomycetota bacterium]